MRTVHAFTMIELLVVIAIIAMLTGILLPAMQLAKDETYEIICRSNLRQYSIAQTAYLNDNYDSFPNSKQVFVSVAKPVAGYEEYCRWHDPTYPPDGSFWFYLKDSKAHLCPKFRNLARIYGQDHPRHNQNIPVIPVYSYSMNAFLGNREFASSNGVLNLSELTRSQSKVFFFSEENMWLRPGCNFVLNDTSLSANGTEWFGTFHNTGHDINSGTVNAIFVDGHSQSVRSALKKNPNDNSEKEFDRFEKYGWPHSEPYRP
jgi:prepilin-type N-terminal cleavage/methylation domain-containing protein